MAYEWVIAGTAFGIKAFFAVLVFAFCAAIVLGLLTLIAGVLGDYEKHSK